MAPVLGLKVRPGGKPWTRKVRVLPLMASEAVKDLEKVAPSLLDWVPGLVRDTGSATTAVLSAVADRLLTVSLTVTLTVSLP